ncbi:MAG: hypothetical protein LBN39_01790 [Planctomycetaceae bacterium]|nr:hypothetical protein [Planctomycetaceae bacterium]
MKPRTARNLLCVFRCLITAAAAFCLLVPFPGFCVCGDCSCNNGGNDQKPKTESRCCSETHHEANETEQSESCPCPCVKIITPNWQRVDNGELATDNFLYPAVFVHCQLSMSNSQFCLPLLTLRAVVNSTSALDVRPSVLLI